MSRQKSITPAIAYTATLRSALEHISDPVWLGSHSPLATPYFLGPLQEAEARGLRLQTELLQAAMALWSGPMPTSRQALAAAVDEERVVLGSRSPRYRYLLLELRYFRHIYPPSVFPQSVEAMPGFVNVSPTRFFIHLEEAINELGKQLLNQLSPALRLERPALVAQPVGRADVREAIAGELLGGRSVAITGIGGIGKTTLGAALIAGWPGAVFWHTFHPGLNDDLNSLLFSLGHFTRGEGSPTLWAQLLATEGKGAPLSQALGMLRMDLESVADRQPLLCFDEIDLLHTSAGEPRRRQHAQVLEFLESLRGVTPLLLIGQRVYIDTDAHFQLEPLPVEATRELLAHLGVELDGPTLLQLQRSTQGNPRLLELFAALYHNGDDVRDVLRLSRTSSGRPLFSRLWHRLDDDERSLLGALSVFRSFAPSEAWPDHRQALSSLLARRLVKTDLAGGIGLQPFFRELTCEALPPGRRAQHEADAALIRSRLGDYTAAAYHFREAGDPSTAVQVWYAHQDQEILAGQAAAAAEVFESIDLSTVDATARNELRVIRNRLALLAGEAERVLEGMEGFRWEEDDSIVAEAVAQWALAHELRDHAELARDKYEEAIAVLSRATARSTGWRLRRGFTYLGESDVRAARNEAERARYDVLRMQGMIDYATGCFDSAHERLSAALEVASSLNDADRMARANIQLAMVAGQQGRIDECQAHAERAIEYLSAIGDRLQLEGLRAEVAGVYLNVRQFEAVIEPAERALAFFERIKHDVRISTISTNLAEAYMELGHLDKAKEMVFKALRMEIARSQPYALYTLGHIHSREGNPPHAETSFSEGISIARMNEDPFIEAYLQRALGALVRDNGRPEESAACFARALELFNRMGLLHEVEETEQTMGLPSEASPSN